MFTNWRRATLWAKPVVILFGPNSFVWLSPYRPLSITSLKRQSSDQILSGFWSWKTIFASAKECLVHISLNHWSAPRKLGLDLVSVNSKTNLNFFLPHFFFTKMYFIQLLTTNALCCVVGQNLWIDWQKLKVWAHTQSGSLDLLLVSLSYSALLVGSEDGPPLILFGATRYLLLAPNGTWHRWSAPVGTAW